MATVYRYSSKEDIPVQQTTLVGDFEFDYSSAQMLKAGADMANVFAELAIRRQEAQDSLAATKASKNRILMEQEMQQAMVDNPDPDAWEQIRAKISAKYGAEYASLKMSKRMRDKQDIEWNAANETLRMNVQLAATNQDIKNDIVESGSHLIDIMSNDDDGKMDAQEEKDAIERYEAALLRDMTPELASIQMEKTLKQGLMGYWINQSKLDPDTVIATMEQRKKALGKKGGEGKDGLTAKDMDDIIASAIAFQSREKRLAAESLRLKQEETSRQMLVDLWDGILEADDIKEAVRLGYLSDTDGRLLMNALKNPDPPKLDLQALATVKAAIEGIGTNANTKQEALSILYANLKFIDPTTGKSLINEIFSEQDKNKSEMKRESRALMEELIRDRDKFTGLFTDDERQILASAEAYLMLDSEIEKAAKEAKPLARRDIMIKAIEIGRQMKKKIKQEEALGIEPGFEPTKITEEKYMPVNTMIRPKDMAEFNANIDKLPTEDAKRRYFNKWYRELNK